MLKAERHQRILQALRGNGGVTVATLAQRLRITEQTIRRDLTELERAGLVQRSHGGAILHPATGVDIPFGLRLGEAAEEKGRIASVAAGLVQPGETVILDAGTTTLALARALSRMERLSVITNALPVATELAAAPEAQVILVGGQVRPSTLSLVGSMARQGLAQLHAHKLFLAAGGVDPIRGLTNSNMVEAEVKQAMIAAAAEVYVLAHGAKVGEVLLHTFAPVRAVKALITTDSAPQTVLEEIRALGVAVILA